MKRSALGIITLFIHVSFCIKIKNVSKLRKVQIIGLNPPRPELSMYQVKEQLCCQLL